MKRLNCSKIRIVLVGFVAALVLGGVSAKGEIIMSEPTNLGPVINEDHGVQECDFSHDGLELYLAAYNRPGGFGDRDIWVAKRETLNSPWQEPVNLGPNVNSSGSELEPSISGDGLELYFGCWDDWILRVCTRPSKDAPWSSPVKIGPPVGSIQPAMEIGSDDAWRPDISSDGLSLYFTSTRVGGYGQYDIWVATRSTKDDPWDEPVNLGPNVNSGAKDGSPSISTDGLTLIFDRGSKSMWATTRKSTDDEWGPAVQLPFNNPPSWFFGPALSPDGSTIYFEADYIWGGYGAYDFWQVKFTPIVDLNGDGIVDAADMCILVNNWHTNSTLCDIAPLPLGDGYVDIKDLIMLAEHLFEEVVPPTPPTSVGSFTENPDGTYTMTDCGMDIWGLTDQFHYAYKTLTGPGSIVARIDSVTNTHPWAKAGVMIRETLDDGSKHAFVCATPGNGVAFLSRNDTNGASILQANQTGITSPWWVKLERDAQGNLTAAHSRDGIAWQSVAGAVARNIPMNPDVHIGLALTSHNADETCQAVFSNVTTTGDVAPKWANQDVGPFGQP